MIMALCNLKIFSESLGMQTDVNVIIPQSNLRGEIGTNISGRKGNLKCLYLLHGLSDDCSIWERRTSIERYAQDRSICVVMPDGARSFYTDMKYGGKYYTYIAKELPQIIREMFSLSAKREDNFIAGLSMGGYGALKIALRECDSFCAAAAFSAVADIHNKIFTNDLVPVFGEGGVIPKEDDLFELAKICEKNPNRPRIFMGEGTEDFMYDDNVRLKELFETLDYDYTYRESEGTHCWKFWDEYIQYALDWLFQEDLK